MTIDGHVSISIGVVAEISANTDEAYAIGHSAAYTITHILLFNIKGRMSRFKCHVAML